MALEVPKALKMETRRLLWVIGLVFTTVILFQCIELPKGNAIWSVFSRSGTPRERISSDFTGNTSSGPVVVSNTSKPSNVNARIVYDQRDDSSVSGKPKIRLPAHNNGSMSNSSLVQSEKEDAALPPTQKENTMLAPASSPVAPPSIPLPLDEARSVASDHNTSVPTVNSSLVQSENEDAAVPPTQEEIAMLAPAAYPLAPPPIPLPLDEARSVSPDHNTSVSTLTMNVNTSPANNNTRSPPLFPVPAATKPKSKIKIPSKEVLTLSDMYELLIQSQRSPISMIPRWPTKADQDLILAKSEIENAPVGNTDGLYAPLYRNASMFRRSYELMEQMLKIYIYKEGDRPIFHRPPLEGIYASEGWFMKLMEANRQFVTNQPEEAQLFYLPFSSRNLEERLYVAGSHSHKNLIQHLKNYLDIISAKYPFWNRTDGADHFLVACHDWAPSETKKYMASCLRALCNADVKENFKFGKDVSLPETYVRKAKDPLKDIGGKAPSKRKILAFFAGNMHGYLRPILLQHWGNANDPDMQIFGKLPGSKKKRNYIDFMKSSKYCICPRGYEVNSPRLVEAIFFECVPVIISDNFIPPFLETLNWESFAVILAEKDIPNLKSILLSIPKKTYYRLHMRVRKVQQHFLWHPAPVKYDLFHMILHSIWYNRVFQFRSS